MPSSSLNILAPTEQLSQLIWTEILGDDTIHIRCNKCSRDAYTFYKGDYLVQPSAGNDWLGNAITHIVKEHPEELT